MSRPAAEVWASAQSLVPERAFIGTILQIPCSRAAPLLHEMQESDFADPWVRTTFNVMLGVVRGGIDPTPMAVC
ncbi:MAG: hypothetical protein ABI808_13535 [Pseudonocardiales bacterium]